MHKGRTKPALFSGPLALCSLAGCASTVRRQHRSLVPHIGADGRRMNFNVKFHVALRKFATMQSTLAVHSATQFRTSGICAAAAGMYVCTGNGICSKRKNVYSQYVSASTTSPRRHHAQLASSRTNAAKSAQDATAARSQPDNIALET